MVLWFYYISVFKKHKHKINRLYELMLCVPVNSYGHVGTLPPFYGTFTPNQDVMTSKKCFEYITQVTFKPLRLFFYVRMVCEHFPGAINGGGGGGRGSGHRSQRFKTQNHKSQSFQMMISQITDNEFS